MDLFEKCGRLMVRPRLAQQAGIYPYFIPIQSSSGPEVIADGRRVVMLGSNNYLGLTQHPSLIEASHRALDRYGTGCTGSRLLNGTLDLHMELERRLALFMRQEAALVFTTGFQVNLGVISALVGRNDLLVLDRADHASIIDGARLSFGKTCKYPHNDTAALETILREHAGQNGMLIVVDGVFSMEGDCANLPEIVRLARQHGARVMVDDAHGIGVMGEGGRGTVAHFGLDDEVDLIMGTFSKSFGATGGFIAGSEDVIYYLKHTARAFLFSASIPPASAAAALAALDLMEQDDAPRRRLWSNVERVRGELTGLGFDLGASTSQIIPIIVGEDFRMGRLWRRLFDDGVFVNAAAAPAVEPGRALLRTSYMATHETCHLDRALEVLERAGRDFGLVA